VTSENLTAKNFSCGMLQDHLELKKTFIFQGLISLQ